MTTRALDPEQLAALSRWNTPSVYNGWEQITTADFARDAVNREPLVDFMPDHLPMVGWAVTVTIEPSNPAHVQQQPDAWSRYRRYIASQPGPKVVVVQDLDGAATHGAFWGEVNTGIHRALGCVGTITDGAIRDVAEVRSGGFRCLARRLCVGHAYSCPVRWGEAVEVFGTRIEPGQLIHADQHGFLAVPHGDEAGLLEATRFMDDNECRSLIPASRDVIGLNALQICDRIDAAGRAFVAASAERFGRTGEW
ncbi:MAG: RraA family protein [Planctomycetota bacterium]|jgi:4-hydroxy-4-methyl-2-oxoglutarate aldolase|nr:RraA family protein [Planctomycetota bacterium]